MDLSWLEMLVVGALEVVDPSMKRGLDVEVLQVREDWVVICQTFSLEML